MEVFKKPFNKTKDRLKVVTLEYIYFFIFYLIMFIYADNPLPSNPPINKSKQSKNENKQKQSY